MWPGRMRRLENVLRFSVLEEVFLVSGIGAPETEDDISRLLVDEFDRSVGEFLPPQVPMRFGNAVLHGQDAVQKENALFSPGNEIASCGPRTPGVSEELGIDVP